jgi:hypothetical protein
MSISPYGERPVVPLSAGGRFIRGFKRIGIVLGATTLLIGLVTTVTMAFNAQSSADQRYAQGSCINDRVRNNLPIKMKSYDQARIDFDASGCPSGPFYSESLSTVVSYAKQKPAPLEHAIEPFAYGSLASVGLAAFLFYGFWLLGWLCAGFTRD